MNELKERNYSIQRRVETSTQISIDISIGTHIKRGQELTIYLHDFNLKVGPKLVLAMHNHYTYPVENLDFKLDGKELTIISSDIFEWVVGDMFTLMVRYL